MLLGYNTNGFAHHTLEDALRILAELGYESVAITLEYHALNPFADGWERECERISELLKRLGLRCVVETGARFLLDPWRKHFPTLVSATASERERRFDFLVRAIETARRLEADAVSFWSGAVDASVDQTTAWLVLIEGCRRLADFAADINMRLAFEPEPGMFIDTMERFERLLAEVAHPAFGLTLDVGHLHCQGELPIGSHIERWRDRLWNVHIEDMRRGVHDHLMFGDGEMDFPPIVTALSSIGYRGGLHVELSRHSHEAVSTAREAMFFLRGQIEAARELH